MTNEEIFNAFKEEQNILNERIFLINTFQKQNGYLEFYDMTIRCSNSLMQAQKFLKSKEYDVDNFPESMMLNAYEGYLNLELQEAIHELNRYILEVEGIFIGKQCTFKNYIKSLLGKYVDYSEYYKSSQIHVDNYYKIGTDIYNLSIEKDMDKILSTFIDNVDASLEEKLSICNALKADLMKLHMEPSIYKLNEKKLTLK